MNTKNKIILSVIIPAILLTPLFPVRAGLVGDLNNDGIVNGVDYSILLSNWFTADTASDLNHDGIVNALDFSLMNSNWLQSAAVSGASIGGCAVFPADNPWNRDVSADPLDPNSNNYITSIGKTSHLHPDFGGSGAYGIPFVTVNGSQAKVPMNFTDYPDESDPGPYPIPSNAPVEGGNSSTGDRHVIVLDSSTCTDYELYNAHYQGPGWDASGGAIFNLNSNALRPDYWTSADAAGLPILAGLVRFDEVAAGSVDHAIRFTISQSQKGFIHPATHSASSSTDPNRPPMGLRLRMKASYDISHLTGESKVIAVALKKYGMIVADNGSNWYITGATDPRWDDEDLNQLKTIPGDAFEVVQSGSIIK